MSEDDVKYPEQKSIFVVVRTKNCKHADNKSWKSFLKGINVIHVQKVFADEFVSNTACLPIRLFAWWLIYASVITRCARIADNGRSAKTSFIYIMPCFVWEEQWDSSNLRSFNLFLREVHDRGPLWCRVLSFIFLCVLLSEERKQLRHRRTGQRLHDGERT